MASVVHGLQATVVDVEGKAKGKMTLPKELFAAKVNAQLMAQAVRVYLANQREGGAATKTRGEVEGSTRKIYRQKGTGKARHGAIRAPIFVGGGIVFGPQPHDFSLHMPVTMKRKALASALTSQLASGNVVVVDGMETLEPKTKLIAKTLSTVAKVGSTLLVISPSAPLVARAARNISDVVVIPATSVNTYEVLRHRTIVFMKDAVGALKNIVSKEA
ncbi:50S ribosomal protein L4 [Candidatus Gottesmanbacteria bacterium RBG_13_45_10]|uniref:Large ribosomal subunit protein uL4 n=1 Tax=Candidatus Gottesmanbacteria bacterium RBG_13_45_10 TaxID=1798370 RepID=A0A1F5ZHN7_9BACT|nr:MAG: 50S ribosomal protein L4 [Candidatus Gottesmanbacteria bacterium RBG_13_45_10]